MLSQQEMNRFNRQIAEVEEHLHHERKIHVEYVDVLSALMAVLKEANPETICRMGLPTEELIRSLEGYAFDAPLILGEIDDPAIEIPGSIRRVWHALGQGGVGGAGPGRGAGTEWEILRNDANPFPSNPSAHNEAEHITMDLSTGNLFHDGEFVHRLRKKELSGFRAKISEKYPDIALSPMAD
jgi:hypothetical protein